MPWVRDLVDVTTWADDRTVYVLGQPRWQSDYLAQTTGRRVVLSDERPAARHGPPVDMSPAPQHDGARAIHLREAGEMPMRVTPEGPA